MIPLLVLAVAAVMIAVERRGIGRPWPRVRGWWGRALLLNGVQFGTAYLATSTWDVWMAGHRPWQLPLGTTGQTLVGYVVITFLYYWWHRWRHEVSFLWRWFHQIHHSPRRIEVITAFYKHPVEILVNGLISSTILYFLVGVSPLAASQAVLITGLAELFYHWNVSTPRWIGFLIQRPESHCVHHQEGLHHYNYADLPLWDMCFRTFRNPPRFDATCGLGEEAELRMGAMLRGVAVSE